MTFFRRYLFLTVALLLSFEVIAEQRGGFYLSGGLGGHSSTIEAYDDYGGSVSESNVGLQTAFKIGGHLNSQVALYYIREASWWKDDDTLTTWVVGLSGIGITYFVENRRTSPYFEAAFGLGDFSELDGGFNTEMTGSSFLIGAGVEVNRNMQIGAIFMRTTADDPYYYDVHWSNRAFAVRAELKL